MNRNFGKGRYLLSLTAVAILAAAFTMTVRIGVGQDLKELRPAETPVIVKAALISERQSQPARLEIERFPPTVLRAPSWSGLVTAVFVQPATLLQNGDLVLAIDDVNRFAWHSEVPFHRVLGQGTFGNDVARLQEMLKSLELSTEEPSGRMTASTLRAISVLAENIGLPRTTAAFDPSWIIWLPIPAWDIQMVSVVPGVPAPAPGSAIATGYPRVSSASVVKADDLPINVNVGWEVAVEGKSLPLGIDGSLTEAAIELLESLPALINDQSGQLSLEVVLQRSEEISVTVLPASSVRPDNNGGACVWVETGGASKFIPVHVTVIGAGRQVGTTLVQGLEEGTTVLVNSGRVLPDASC